MESNWGFDGGMSTLKDVDSYIEGAPEEIQSKLREIRETIKKSVPKAEEKISYAMPYYGYKGRLIYFAYWKKHIAIYAMSSEVIKRYEKELKPFLAEKGTIKIPLDEVVPASLIEKIVKAQAQMNESSAKKN